jgi:hypothetical protein
MRFGTPGRSHGSAARSRSRSARSSRSRGCWRAGPLLTIEECGEVGGTPLFDPADERPLAASCPDGLGFLGVFEEPFFGTDGGICCGGPDATNGADVATEP